ncbi:MAG: M6 family metalloprotease domain-containing protein [Prevotella sp.]|nr:M6 family metalloprotease domain-containing protein [Prevotella sp.]
MKKIILILSLVLTAATSWAAKVYPEPVTVTQSDGTQLTIIGYGDEDFHWYTTTDGVLLAQEGTAFFVAEIDENGDISATRQLAHELPHRSAAEKQLVSAQAPRMKAFFKGAADKRQKAMQRRIPLGNASPAYFPHTGEPRAMVILVQFADTTFSMPDPVKSFNQYLNAEGQGNLENFGLYENRNYGSVKQYFSDMSGGLFRPQFDVFGPVTLPNKLAYYGKDSGSTKDVNLSLLVKEACKAIDDTVDFSQYDANKDGNVDLVYVIYAGYGQSISGNSSDCIWPRSGSQDFGTYDGVKVRRYGVNNEVNRTPAATPKMINGIGLFCHEFSHTLGLPDIYPTGTNSTGQTVDNQTLEYWDLMDGGEYTDMGYVPTPYTPWEKEVMGWTEIEELTDTAQITLTQDKYYKIKSDTNGEYLILQNFQNTQWAQRVINMSLRCHGLLVYRVDYSDSNGKERSYVNAGDAPNNTAGKPGMTLAPADGLLINSFRVYGSDITKKTDSKPYSTNEYINSHQGDPYPGSKNVTELLSVKMNRCTIEKPIYNIKEEDGIITFDFLKDFVAAGIDGIVSDNSANGKANTYDLQGRKMTGNELRKGIYIKNGRKIVVK